MSYGLVYLSGPICGATYEEMSSWRNHATDCLGQVGIKTRSPLRHKDWWLKRAKTEEERHGNQGCPWSDTPRALVVRDRFDIQAADVVLVNLEGAKKVSIGTMVELGWADAFRKPVVLSMDDFYGNPHYQHPFLDALAPFRANNLDSAIELAKGLLLSKGVHT